VQVCLSTWSKPRCDHVETKIVRGRMQKTYCDAIEVEAQFTMPLKQAIGLAKEDRQPRYYCVKHRRKHPNYGAISGERRW